MIYLNGAKTTTFAIESSKVKEISCGHHHTLILSKDGSVHACGLKEYGALGFGETNGVVEAPTKVDIAEDPINTVAAGTHLSFAVTDKGNAMWKTNCSRCGLDHMTDSLIDTANVKMMSSDS